MYPFTSSDDSHPICNKYFHLFELSLMHFNAPKLNSLEELLCLHGLHPLQFSDWPLVVRVTKHHSGKAILLFFINIYDDLLDGIKCFCDESNCFLIVLMYYTTFLQVISPELTFFNSSKYVGESPLFSNKFLHARLDAFCRSLFLSFVNFID